MYVIRGYVVECQGESDAVQREYTGTALKPTHARFPDNELPQSVSFSARAAQRDDCGFGCLKRRNCSGELRRALKSWTGRGDSRCNLGFARA